MCIAAELYYMIMHNLGKDSRDFLKPIKLPKGSAFMSIYEKLAI